MQEDLIPIPDMKYGANLGDRLSLRREKLASRRIQGVIGYSLSDGYYREQKSDGQLVSPTKGIQARIEQQLHDSAREYPIIVLDFGGGFGISMIELAEKYEKDVLAGSIVFAVSNIETEMPSEENAKLLLDTHNLSSTHVDLWDKKKHLIQYLQGDAEELQRCAVRGVDGQSIPLAGNVNILHEHYALCHSYIVDHDLPALGRLMYTNGGVMFIHSNSLELSVMRVGNVVPRDLFQVGFDNLRRAGHIVSAINEGDFQGYRSIQSGQNEEG
ncbi:MAG TPA: hypothetical protein ENI23_17600 [bacterium]|nr:hypothetical protein [bacterium]